MVDAVTPVDRTIEALRVRLAAWRKAGERIALVPTMGALHAGHIELVRMARSLARRVVVAGAEGEAELLARQPSRHSMGSSATRLIAIRAGTS